MTREIKFRGKSAGEWHYGHFFAYRNTGGGTGAHFIVLQEKEDENLKPIQVMPETVGQYTGLRDKNGKEIYEGDIVKWTGKTNETLLCYVDWHKHLCKFYLSFGEEQKVNDTKTDIFEMMRMGYNYEVIGNIHDNPEILKG